MDMNMDCVNVLQEPTDPLQSLHVAHLTILILRDHEMKLSAVAPSCSTAWVTNSLSSAST